jgi:Flp pilus assembly protein CpaB
VKKKPNLLPFIIAGFLFLIAIFALFKWQQIEAQKAADAVAAQKTADAQALLDAQAKQINVTPTATNMREVLYATQPIEADVRISPAFFEMKMTPVDILPGAYTDKDTEYVTGAFAIRPIEKGDPLSSHNIGKSLPYLSQRIPPGMRAIALPIFNADYNSTGGFVVDGDKVDLLYTVSSLEGDMKLNTQTILQNVNVLYVPGPPTKDNDTIAGVNPIPPPGGTIAVTFMVTPEEAQELVFLSGVKNGKFSMILRSRKDDTEIKVKPFIASDYDPNNLSKVQRTADKSEARVKALAAEIEAAAKQQQGTTNETNTPPAAP